MSEGISKFQRIWKGLKVTKKEYKTWYAECFSAIYSLSHHYDTHRHLIGLEDAESCKVEKMLCELACDFRVLDTQYKSSKGYRKLALVRGTCLTLMGLIGNTNLKQTLNMVCPSMLSDLSKDDANVLKFWSSLMCLLSYKVQESQTDVSGDKGKLQVSFETKLLPRNNDVALMLSKDCRHAILKLSREGFKETCTFDVIFNEDRGHVYRNHSTFLSKKRDVLRRMSDTIGEDFADTYLEQMSLRDIAVNKVDTLVKKVADAKVKTKKLQNALFHEMLNDFRRQRPLNQLETISLLLQLPTSQRNDAELLLDFLHRDPEKRGLSEAMRRSVDMTLQDKLDQQVHTLRNTRKTRDRIARQEVSYETRIEAMNVSEDVKEKAFRQLKTIKRSKDGDVKLQTYLDNLLRIPFGVYREEEMLSGLSGLEKDATTLMRRIEGEHKNNLKTERNLSRWLRTVNKTTLTDEVRQKMEELDRRFKSHTKRRSTYVKEVRQALDKSVYGHQRAKSQLERIVCQWITGKQTGMILGLQGPPGVGKTSLIKEGLAKCLKDASGRERPFAFLPLGGLSGSSFLVGHNYTYQGSKWGRVADVLMDAKCMNPIIFIDELDKVSRTERGEEIIGILTHMTDSTQNTQFYDRYFSGIPLDLSKVLFVFSFNDMDKIDRVLRDRITCIRVDPLTSSDKLEIARHFLLPDILSTVGIPDEDVNLSREDLHYLINTFTFEAGVRRLKQLLFHVVREVNRRRVLEDEDERPGSPPPLDRSALDDILGTFPKRIRRCVSGEKLRGVVNGMYANSLGVGGITPVEVSMYRSRDAYGLKLTGQQGDVMKESMECAKTVAFNLLDRGAMDSYLARPYGLHVHCPDASVRKDGPSAGTAIAVAIYSYISGSPVDSNTSVTGEIDLHGKVRAVGGLQAKLHGVCRAGVKIALVPSENEDEILGLRRRGKLPPESDLRVIFIDHVRDALKIMCGVGEESLLELV